MGQVLEAKGQGYLIASEVLAQRAELLAALEGVEWIPKGTGAGLICPCCEKYHESGYDPRDRPLLHEDYCELDAAIKMAKIDNVEDVNGSVKDNV